MDGIISKEDFKKLVELAKKAAEKINRAQIEALKKRWLK